MTSEARPLPHTLVAHIPLVVWGMSFVFDVLSYFGGSPFVEAALFNVVAGLVAMLAAGVTEAWDYRTRLSPGSPARRFARWHGVANLVATALFVASLALRAHERGAVATPRGPFVLSALGVAVLGVASWIGGLVDWEYAATTRRQSRDAH
ncbi:MAG TPA: DUF2231 domain-containing protein [Polyangia bacterium]|nr:DUF2231 domain-containing protein [Polyangia bacterium]